jgi:hypothetical protein
LSRILETAYGPSAALAAFKQVISRLAPTDSEIKLDEKVRFKNPSNACRNFLWIRNERGKSLNLELQKPGMASKNASNAKSSSSVSRIRSSIMASISEDGFAAISVAALRLPFKNPLL